MRRGVALGIAVVAFLAVAALIAVVAGRPAPPGPGSPGAPTPTPVVFGLQTVPGPVSASGQPMACAGVGLSSVLRGNPADPRLAWLIDVITNRRTDVVWPAGFHARFAPGLEVLDAAGDVVARDGDLVDGACVIDANGGLEVVPEEPMFAIRCGPLPVSTCVGGNAAFQVRETLRSRFAGRDPMVVQFVSSEGAYLVTFADGGQFAGQVNLGQ